MVKNKKTHLNKQQGPFNKAWYYSKNNHTQVNGHTELSQDSIILKNDVVTRNKY